MVVYFFLYKTFVTKMKENLKIFLGGVSNGRITL